MNLNSDDNTYTLGDAKTNYQMSNEKTALLPGTSASTEFKAIRTPYRRTSQRARAIRNQLHIAMNDTRTLSAQNISIVILLIVNACERFAYYGIICNYVLFLNRFPLDWTSYNASALLLIFLGITYMSSLLGGWLADSFIGKYLTILISYIIYIIGYSIFPLVSYTFDADPTLPFQICQVKNKTTQFQNTSLLSSHRIKTALHEGSSPRIFDETCSLPVFFSVITMGIAVGILKANLGPFGADQVQSRGQPMVFKYFSWLYWSINLGSLLSFTLLAFVQQNVSFYTGYLIPFIVLVFSFLLFLSGSGSYVKTVSETSVLSNIFSVVIEAFRSAKRQKNLIRQKERERALLDDDDDSIRSTDSMYESYNNTNSLLSSSRKNISWLDHAKIRYGGRYDDGLVDDVKALRKVIILFAILIPYWVVYLQIETMFVVQGLHMKVFIENGFMIFGSEKIIMPLAWLSLSDQLTILLVIPLLDSVVYPLLKQDIKVTGNARLVLGMSFSALAVILAGLLETYRIHYILEDPQSHIITQNISDTTYYAANLTIFWQIPQYICVGLGEVFCSVTAVYYAYSIAPKSMESILMGLFFFFTGLGGFLGSFLLFVFKSVIYSSSQSDDLNCAQCQLYYYFFALALLQIVGVVAFIWLDSKFSITVEEGNSTAGNERTFFTPNFDSTLTSTQDPDSESEEGSRSFSSPVNL